jgi:hypothetical protein
MRVDQELIGTNTQLGRELIYGFKFAIGTHISPENVHIVKINPVITGIKSHVVKTIQRLEKHILDAWYFKDELGEHETLIEAGQRLNANKILYMMPNC